MNYCYKLFFLSFFSLISVNLSWAQIKAFSEKSSFEWLPIDQAIAKAQSEKKMVMLAFHAENCPYCRKMELEVYSKPEIQQLISLYFVPAKLDMEHPLTFMYKGVVMTTDRLASIFKVEGTPTLTFLNDEGDLVAYQPGFIQPELFKKLMEYVGTGVYATMSFSDFTGDQF
jgi:thioredoxin-related protein